MRISDWSSDVCSSDLLTDTDNGCIPFNRLGIGTASQEARDWVLGNPFRNQKFQQDVFAANLSFDPFDLPAGPVSAAIGGAHRRATASGAVLPDYQSGWFVGHFLPSLGSYPVTDARSEEPRVGKDLLSTVKSGC